jgi:hypothetical protein
MGDGEFSPSVAVLFSPERFLCDWLSREPKGGLRSDFHRTPRDASGQSTLLGICGLGRNRVQHSVRCIGRMDGIEDFSTSLTKRSAMRAGPGTNLSGLPTNQELDTGA